jgi:hypothetical protein
VSILIFAFIPGFMKQINYHAVPLFMFLTISAKLLAGGLIESYLAVSSLRNMPVSQDFVRFVTEIASKNVKELDLSLCPGVDATAPSKFDFLSIALALRNNSYFE